MTPISLKTVPQSRPHLPHSDPSKTTTTPLYPHYIGNHMKTTTPSQYTCATCQVTTMPPSPRSADRASEEDATTLSRYAPHTANRTPKNHDDADIRKNQPSNPTPIHLATATTPSKYSHKNRKVTTTPLFLNPADRAIHNAITVNRYPRIPPTERKQSRPHSPHNDPSKATTSSQHQHITPNKHEPRATCKFELHVACMWQRRWWLMDRLDRPSSWTDSNCIKIQNARKERIK